MLVSIHNQIYNKPVFSSKIQDRPKSSNCMHFIHAKLTRIYLFYNWIPNISRHHVIKCL